MIDATDSSDPLPPLRMRPIFKRTIWGGRRLADVLDKSIGDGDDFAESWEVVDHGDNQSVVDGGPLDSVTLRHLIQTRPESLFGSGRRYDRFPLLLKYLDCNRVLSVQVHPDDSYAKTMNPPDLGKTEAWYIVEADQDAVIYAGLRDGVDRQALKRAVDAGQTDQVLHSFKPKVGDVVFIPAGTVHALGAGLLVAEIQQSSNTTFRLFDWNRVDNDGRHRPLHLQKGLEVTDYHRGPISASRADESVMGKQTLVECDKFNFSAVHGGEVDVGVHDGFEIVTVPRGSALLRIKDETWTIQTGQTVLIPASCPSGMIRPSDGGVVLLMS